MKLAVVCVFGSVLNKQNGCEGRAAAGHSEWQCSGFPFSRCFAHCRGECFLWMFVMSMKQKKNQATPEIHVLIKELSVWAAGLLALFHTETARSQRHWSGLSLCSWRFNSGFLTRCCSVCSHRTHFIISSSLIKSISLSCWYTCPHLWLITSSASFKWTHHSSTDNS